MTLNDGIKRTEEKANLNWANKNFTEHSHYSQLVDWLKELKRRRTLEKRLWVTNQHGGGCLLNLNQIKSFGVEPCSELYLGIPGTEFAEQYPRGVTAKYTIVAYINSRLKYCMGVYLWCEDAMRAMQCLTDWIYDPDKAVFEFPPLEEMNLQLRAECC